MNADCKKVSAVVLNWNGWKDTIDCVSSLLQSDYANLEVVVVDNGSDDDSCDRIREAFPDIRIEQTGVNLGFTGGNNHGFAATDGDYVLAVNNDTLVDVACVTNLVKVADMLPKAGAVGAINFSYDRPEEVVCCGLRHERRASAAVSGGGDDPIAGHDRALRPGGLHAGQRDAAAQISAGRRRRF